MMRQFIDGDALAEQRHHVAAPRRVGGQIGNVDGHQIHRNAPRHRATLAGDDNIGAAGAVIGAGRAKVPVGIAGRRDREPGRPPRGPGSAVTDGLAALDIADLHDAGLDLDNRLHRIVGFRCRVDAVECRSRAHHVELELRAKEDAGGV
jgi:hypothetical protein